MLLIVREDQCLPQVGTIQKEGGKAQEVSLDSPLMTELPKVELPKDENKLLNEDDELGTSIIPDLSLASEEGKRISLTTVWGHAIETLFKLSTMYPDGIRLKKQKFGILHTSRCVLW